MPNNENPIQSQDENTWLDTAGIVYATGSWPEEGFGSQRAVVHVDTAVRAVGVRLPWRRRDAEPHKKDIRIFDAAGRRVANVDRKTVNRELGEISFEPIAGAGDYLIYFMPCSAPKLFEDSTYFPPVDTADPAWLVTRPPFERLPQARLLRFEARTGFDRRDPMELPATSAEQAGLMAAHPDDLYLIFPEDRLYPLRMSAELPYRWIRRGPGDHFEGQARPGETYAFQLGVYACREAVGDVTFVAADLHGPDGAQISAGEVRCINLAGTDWEGRAFRKTFSVDQGQVRPLWVLVSVPEDARPGDYTGEIVLQPLSASAGTDEDQSRAPVFISTRLQLTLTVAGDVLEEHGSRDAWRQSRLGWLDSTKGSEDEVIAPYVPLAMEADTIHLLGRSLRFGLSGFPESLVSNGRELLKAPIAFIVGEQAFKPVSTRVLQTGAARIRREWRSQGDGMLLTVLAQVDFDGCIEYRVGLQAERDLHTGEIRLNLALDSGLTEYFMGLGVRGGRSPQQVDWKWDVERITNMLWTGNAQAGLHLNLMHSQDIWPQAYTYRLWGTPASWDFAGTGACRFERQAQATTIIAASGSREWQAGETAEFRFRLLVTPFKPLDQKQWGYRYWKKTALHEPDPDNGAAQGVTVGHLHHGLMGVNPWINYPFLTLDAIRAYRQHLLECGYRDVDVYYTLREISSHMSELWALRSLGGEIFVGGDEAASAKMEIDIYKPGGGYAWLQEHLVDGYARAWQHVYADGAVDAAIATQGLSRLHNFYVEGLDLLMKATGVGGLYLDGLAYGRSVLQRVARVMARNRQDYRIKFHSGNNYDFSDWHCNVLLQYAEHLPYITDLWIGEMFDYDLPPDYWLVEMSGIPFGLTSEMLNYETGGNPWRGMLYGMDGRMHPSAPHLWKLWDDFGIQDAVLQGYWEAACPVRTGQADILASAYVKAGKTLAALASWCKEDAQVKLSIDWDMLGLRPEQAVLQAPEIPGFQPAAAFNPADPILVPAGRGWLLIIGMKS